MNIEEYKKQLKELERDFNNKKTALLIQYAESNDPYKIGDVIEDYIGKLKITRKRPYCRADIISGMMYFGVELKKDGTPLKKQTGRAVYQENIIP